MQDYNEINSIWFNEINVNNSYSTKQHVTNAGIIITCKIEREKALESMQKNGRHNSLDKSTLHKTVLIRRLRVLVGFFFRHGVTCTCSCIFEVGLNIRSPSDRTCS